METTINITTDELALLAYLHEHATGYTPADVLRRQDIQKMTQALNLIDVELQDQRRRRPRRLKGPKERSVLRAVS